MYVYIYIYMFNKSWERRRGLKQGLHGRVLNLNVDRFFFFFFGGFFVLFLGGRMLTGRPKPKGLELGILSLNVKAGKL